jgi:hypothetical protein
MREPERNGCTLGDRSCWGSEAQEMSDLRLWSIAMTFVGKQLVERCEWTQRMKGNFGEATGA